MDLTPSEQRRTFVDLRRAAGGRDAHSTSLAAFRSLDAGGAMEVTSDRSLEPLYFELLVEADGAFDWEYFECGPTLWRACVSRRNPGAWSQLAARP